MPLARFHGPRVLTASAPVPHVLVVDGDSALPFCSFFKLPRAMRIHPLDSVSIDEESTTRTRRTRGREKKKDVRRAIRSGGIFLASASSRLTHEITTRAENVRFPGGLRPTGRMSPRNRPRSSNQLVKTAVTPVVYVWTLIDPPQEQLIVSQMSRHQSRCAPDKGDNTKKRPSALICSSYPSLDRFVVILPRLPGPVDRVPIG